MELCFSISSSVDSIDISPVSASCLRESGNLYFMHRPFSTLPPPSHHHHRPQCQVRHNRPNSQDWGKLWVICILWYRRQVICILCRNLELRIRQGRLLSYRRQWLRISAAILKLLSCWPFLKDGLKHQHHYHHLKHHQWLQIELLTEITNKSLAMMMTAPLGSRRADTESSWWPTAFWGFGQTRQPPFVWVFTHISFSLSLTIPIPWKDCLLRQEIL